MKSTYKVGKEVGKATAKEQKVLDVLNSNGHAMNLKRLFNKMPFKVTQEGFLKLLDELIYKRLIMKIELENYKHSGLAFYCKGVVNDGFVIISRDCMKTKDKSPQAHKLIVREFDLNIDILEEINEYEETEQGAKKINKNFCEIWEKKFNFDVF